MSDVCVQIRLYNNLDTFTREIENWAVCLKRAQSPTATRTFWRRKPTLLPVSLYGYRTGDWLVNASERCARQLTEISWPAERPGIGDSCFGCRVWYILSWAWPAEGEDKTCLRTRRCCRRRRGMLLRQIVPGVGIWNSGLAVEPFRASVGRIWGHCSADASASGGPAVRLHACHDFTFLSCI
jgi:hypothetical protein